MKRDKERDFENSSLCTRTRFYTDHCLPYKPQFHCLQVRVLHNVKNTLTEQLLTVILHKTKGQRLTEQP